jgi:beta-glucosidase
MIVSATAVPATASIDVSVNITNIGDRAGEEVVQLYLHDLDASVTRPVKQLAGFKRIALAAGQRAMLAFHVDLSQIAFHDDTMQFVIEPGPIEDGMRRPVSTGCTVGYRASTKYVGDEP